MIIVSLGTRAQLTAVTILAPSLAMPPASYLRPTMKPAMFCRNTSGSRRWQVVQGPTFGGGIGLVACCDIVIAAETANFCFSEVKLGLIPAVISPYVIAAIGERPARRYFLTAETFGAREALRLGLVHEVVADEALQDIGRRVLKHLLKGGPGAQVAAKDLIRAISRRPLDDDLVEETAKRIARIRTSDEGREGIAAFLEKRRPDWLKG